MLRHKIDISILIPSYNEEKRIIAKLNDIISLNYPKDKIEVLIMDCSTDNTVKLVQDFIKLYPDRRILIIHENERKGVAYATNKGKVLASGEIIVRTDADSTLDKECLNHLLKTFEDKKIGCVTGKSFPIGSIKEVNYRNINTKIQLIESKIDSTIISHGPFTAFRKNIPFEIDEIFTADDSEISIKVRKLRYRSVLNPDIIFFEKTSIDGREEQKVRRASGLILLLWRNKDVFFNLNYDLYGLIIFPFNFIITIIMPILLSPLLIILMYFNITGGTVLETFQFLLKGIHRILFTNKATIHWEQDKNVRQL